MWQYYLYTRCRLYSCLCDKIFLSILDYYINVLPAVSAICTLYCSAPLITIILVVNCAISSNKLLLLLLNYYYILQLIHVNVWLEYLQYMQHVHYNERILQTCTVIDRFAMLQHPVKGHWSTNDRNTNFNAIYTFIKKCIWAYIKSESMYYIGISYYT